MRSGIKDISFHIPCGIRWELPEMVRTEYIIFEATNELMQLSWRTREYHVSFSSLVFFLKFHAHQTKSLAAGDSDDLTAMEV